VKTTAWSRYNGLQSEFRVQDWHGLSGAGRLPGARPLTIRAKSSPPGGGSTVAGAQNPFDISSGEKALSGLDFPKIAALYLIYDLPFYKSQKGFLGKLLGLQANTLWHFSRRQLWTPTFIQCRRTREPACQISFDSNFLRFFYFAVRS